MKTEPFCLTNIPPHLLSNDLHRISGDETVWKQDRCEGCPEVFASVRLDDDVADDVIEEDHGSNEGEGKVVEVGGQEGQDGSPADDVENVENHPDNQLAVG